MTTSAPATVAAVVLRAEAQLLAATPSRLNSASMSSMTVSDSGCDANFASPQFFDT